MNFRSFRLGLQHFFKDPARPFETICPCQCRSESHKYSRVSRVADTSVLKQWQRLFIPLGSNPSQPEIFLELVVRRVARHSMLQERSSLRIAFHAEQRQTEVEIGVQEVRLQRTDQREFASGLLK